MREAKNARELDTAGDVAAVLDWRLDSTGTHSTGHGPLPWTIGIPDGLAGEHDLNHLRTRARVVADLADQIRTDTQHWTPATAPRWARPLIGTHPSLVEELAVWRASLHIDDRDPQLTGPARRSVLERAYQQSLDDRVTEALGDPHRPANTWAPVVETIAVRVVTDPCWPIIAEKIDVAARAGIDIATRLTDAAHTRPLPDEMPAAALWSRLELEASALDTTPTHTLRPDWIPDLHTLLGEPDAERVIADPAWPRLVAALDRAAGSDWTPHELLTTAFELILGAQPFAATALRPDQLADALTWRIDALLRQPFQSAPTPPEPDTTMHPHTSPTNPPPDTEPPTPEPARATSETDAGSRNQVPDNIDTIAALLQAGDLAAARRALGQFAATLDETERDIIERVATTLYTYPFINARARLQWAADHYPQHRALIHACTPTTDPHTYQHRNKQPPPSIPRENYLRPAHDLPDRHDPTRIRPPRPDTEIRAEHQAQDYEDTRGDIDETVEPVSDDTAALTTEEKERQAIPEGVPHRYYTENRSADRYPDSTEPHYDQFADLRTTTLPCVSCGISRPAETRPRPPRRTEDGLCGDCRDDARPPIPDGEPADRLAIRCDHIAATHPPETLRGLLLRDWRAARTLAERLAINSWVQAHPLPQVPVTPDNPADRITENPLIVLTDTELEQQINDLELRITLAHDDTNLYEPAPQSPADTSEYGDQIRRHQAAQTAIRTARAAESTLANAVRTASVLATELDTARAAFESTPGHRRRTRRDLQTHINSLTTRHQDAIRTRENARALLRDAHRNATDLTGTTHEWDRILIQPSPPRPEPQPTQLISPNPVIDEFRNQLDQLQSERHRRRQLSAASASDEAWLRQQVVSPTDELTNAPQRSTELRDRPHDPDVGI